MKKNTNSYLAIFLVSLHCIALELFLTRILNLKAWNHVVYTVIPFAMLGYGIGANIVLVFNDFFRKYKADRLIAWLLFLIAYTSFTTAGLIKDLPIRVDYILSIFTSFQAISMLLLAYTLFMIPFLFMGFLVVYLFLNNREEGHKLYFFDLLGAGLGAYVFFPLINHLAIFQSLSCLSFACLLLAAFLLFPAKKIFLSCLGGLSFFIFLLIFPEPGNYSIDPKKGWEWIPGYFQQKDYQHLISQWHPLGRTDAFRITDEKTRARLYRNNLTFEINVDPPPEFSYFSTNFLAGTPVYEFSKKGLAKNHSQIKPFSQVVEVAYTLLQKPKVFVIGVGGGRDIFMAHTHGAQEIIGAEINTGIVKEMSPGGRMYEYSGRIYTSKNTKIYAVDGRHLVKTLEPKSLDLIILNGVDTFSGLSSGAYAYAESYLYTQNAIEDYLRVLKDDGIINLFRWAFPKRPREELRLQAIALAALKKAGVRKPWDHIMIGLKEWSIFLIKKTPFTPEEREIVNEYFRKHGVLTLYPAEEWLEKSDNPLTPFAQYARNFRQNTQRNFERSYPYDISVITDDNPFFYKYYKFNSFNLFHPYAVHHTGPIVFLTQAMILLQAILFIFLFIFFPLVLFKKKALKNMPTTSILPFIVFFGCIGTGFMFIEIPLMQRFVLLLGNPIYSISVVLAVLLTATGTGSLLVPSLEKMAKSKNTLLSRTTLCLFLYLGLLIVLGTNIFNFFMEFPFLARVLLVSMILFPAGFLLGIFFPSGLRLICHDDNNTIAWAWGINCGFSVLGSILSIIIAQFRGFNMVLILACILYFLAYLSFKRMGRHL